MLKLRNFFRYTTKRSCIFLSAHFPNEHSRTQSSALYLSFSFSLHVVRTHLSRIIFFTQINLPTSLLRTELKRICLAREIQVQRAVDLPIKTAQHVFSLPVVVARFGATRSLLCIYAMPSTSRTTPGATRRLPNEKKCTSVFVFVGWKIYGKKPSYYIYGIYVLGRAVMLPVREG